MARVHELRANKDYPAQGIKKGDTYYKWTTRMTSGKSFISRVHRSKTRPSRSQLTSSEFLGTLYDIQDSQIPNAQTPEDFDDIAEAVRTLGQGEQDKFDNMPEGLQQGETGQMLEERASQCEEWASAIDDAVQTFRDAIDEDDEDSDEDSDDEDREQAKAAREAEALDACRQEVENSCPF